MGQCAFGAGCVVRLGWRASVVSAQAFAAGDPEKPITEACSGPIKAGGGVEVCGTLNPHSKENLASAYFTFSPGSTCTGNDRAPIDIAAGQEEAIKVSAELTGLEPNAEYAYCLVAKNSVGKLPACPRRFTPPRWLPRS